jgi:hypothetical protein
LEEGGLNVTDNHAERSSHPEATESASGSPGSHTSHTAASEQSIWPVVLALGVLIAAIGLLAWTPIAVLGVAVVVIGIVGWLWQPWETA